MTDAGELIRVSRGLFCSPDYIPGNNHSIIEAQKVIKQGVVCLLSALSFHEIGTQNPSEIWMAIPINSWKPAIEALKDGIGNKRTTVDELLYFADICRVKKIITPYISVGSNDLSPGFQRADGPNCYGDS